MTIIIRIHAVGRKSYILVCLEFMVENESGNMVALSLFLQAASQTRPSPVRYVSQFALRSQEA